jgi:hypothetical protein
MNIKKEKLKKTFINILSEKYLILIEMYFLERGEKGKFL